MNKEYKNKYLKYKNKYFNLVKNNNKLVGGSDAYLPIKVISAIAIPLIGALAFLAFTSTGQIQTTNAISYITSSGSILPPTQQSQRPPRPQRSLQEPLRPQRSLQESPSRKHQDEEETEEDKEEDKNKDKKKHEADKEDNDCKKCRPTKSCNECKKKKN